MNRIYPEFKTIGVGNPIKDFKISFISTRLAKLILRKMMVAEWDVAQIPTIPVTNLFLLNGFVPAFSSPVNNGVLFIKEDPGLFYIRLKI